MSCCVSSCLSRFFKSVTKTDSHCIAIIMELNLFIADRRDSHKWLPWGRTRGILSLILRLCKCCPVWRNWCTVPFKSCNINFSVTWWTFVLHSWTVYQGFIMLISYVPLGVRLLYLQYPHSEDFYLWNSILSCIEYPAVWKKWPQNKIFNTIEGIPCRQMEI